MAAIFCLFQRSLEWNPTYLAILAVHAAVNALRPFPVIVFSALIVDALLEEGRDFKEALYLVLDMARSIFLLSLAGDSVKGHYFDCRAEQIREVDTDKAAASALPAK